MKLVETSGQQQWRETFDPWHPDLLDILCHAAERCPVVDQRKQDLETTSPCFCQYKVQAAKDPLVKLACTALSALHRAT